MHPLIRPSGPPSPLERGEVGNCIMLNTPTWWYRRHAEGAPWWRFALWPLSLLWLAVGAVKAATAKPYRSNLFVISIGNLTLGGSGKTPVADMVLRLLGNRAVGLSRGYGGSLEGPVLVDPARHTAAEVGDEPLMLAQNHDFVVAKDRAAGLRLIEASNADVVVVDDAHQNLKIAKDLHILVVDGDTSHGAWPFGDGGVSPYGPLREPFDAGLARADVVVLWIGDSEFVDPELQNLFSAKPTFIARLVAQNYWSEPRTIGFAGIAKPWKFETTLRKLGCKVLEFHAFPDHVSPSETELENLLTKANELDASLFTTEKDYARLSPEWQTRVRRVPIFAQFDDTQGFDLFMLDKIKNRRL